MLILSRKIGESINIGDNIEVSVSRISGDRVTLGLKAPRTVRIVRQEIQHVPTKTPRPYGAVGVAPGEPCFRYGCKETIVADDLGDVYCPRCGWDSKRDEEQ